MNKVLALICVISIITVLSGLVINNNVVVGTNPTFENLEIGANQTAMQNLSDEITTLLTDIIPVFVILGVFGAVIAYVGKMTKGFGS